MSLSDDLRIKLNHSELSEDEYVNNWLIIPNENKGSICNCCFAKVKRPCLSLVILSCFWLLLFIFGYIYMKNSN